MAPPDLFRDLKFFILQRVPSRLALVAAVKDHGGTIVPLEKSADILIGDHARKDVPPGFTSWYFITESVKNGCLDDREKHRISPPAKSAGSTTTKGVGKGTRVAFTKEDDELLRLWVALPANREAGTSGNVIFKQLEEKNPRHTWQSWRDRWVKKLSLAAPAGGPLRHEEEEEVERGSETPAEVTSSMARNSRKGTRVPFTQEDDDFLRAWVLRPENMVTATSGNKLFQELAEENPRHTWHSWRDRWIKKLAPSATATTPRNPPHKRGAGTRDVDVKPRPQIRDNSPRHSPARTAPLGSPSPAKAAQSAHEPTPPARQDRVEETIEVRSNPSKIQPDDSFPPVRNESSPQRSEGSRPSSRHSHASSETAARDQFYENLQSYRAIIEKPLVTSVTITRRSLDMWKLWSTVTRQEEDPELRDWEDIARQLGFDWVSNPTVTHQLKKAFEVHLRDFELLRQEYLKAQKDIDDSDSAAASQSLGQDQEQTSSPAAAQTPPSVAGIKRTWDQTFEPGFRSSISFGYSPNKRREYDRDEVVPESPQVVAIGSATANLSSPMKSPVQALPAPSVDLAEPQQLPSASAVPTSRPVEPETQDFGVIYDHRDRSPSPSPSQQLRLESLSVSPNPFPLARKSARKISPSARLLASRAPVPSEAVVISSASSSRESSPTARVSAKAKRGVWPERQLTPPRRSHPISNTPMEANGSPKKSSSSESGFNIEEEVDRLVSLGLDASVVIKAFKCTNMNKHLAGTVLNALCEHKPIPEQHGVWTSTDDGALRYITEKGLAQAPEALGNAARDRRARMARQRAKLVAKHGEEALEERRIFLRDWVVPQGYEDADKASDGPARRERTS